MAGQFSVGVLFHLLDQVSAPMKKMSASMAASMQLPMQRWKQYGQSMEDFGKKLYKQGRLGSRIGRELMMSVTLPMAMVGVGAFKAAAELENLELRLEAVTRSSIAAKGALKEMRDFQKLHTGFGTADLGASVTALMKGKDSSKDLQGQLQMLGELSAAMGKPMEKLAETFADAKRKNQLGGLLSMMEDEGIPITEKLAQRFGVAKRDVGALMSIGVIGFAAVNDELKKMTSKGGEYYGWMDKRAKTLDGQLERLMTSLKGIGKGFGEGMDIVAIVTKLAGALEKVSRAMTNLGKNHPMISKIIFGFIFFISLLGPLTWGLGKVFKILAGVFVGFGKLIGLISPLYRGFLILRWAMTGFSLASAAALWPFLAIAAAIGAAVYVTYLFHKNLDKIAAWFNKNGQWLLALLQGVPVFGMPATSMIAQRMAEKATGTKDKVDVTVKVKADEGTTATTEKIEKKGNPNVKVKSESSLGAMLLQYGAAMGAQ